VRGCRETIRRNISKDNSQGQIFLRRLLRGLDRDVAQVIEGRLTTKQAESLVEDLLAKHAISEEILHYLPSPQFVTQLRYLLNASVGLQYCPRLDCWGTLEHETWVADGSDEVCDAKVFCKKCRWSYEPTKGPLNTLEKRIAAIREGKIG